MACNFAPEILRHHYDEAGEKPISRAGHLKFRDELIKLLGKVRTKTITGTITITNLSLGSSAAVTVDHSAAATMCFSEYPYFSAVDGLNIVVLAVAYIDGTSYATSGSRWVAQITNINSSAAYVSLSISWSRTGMLA